LRRYAQAYDRTTDHTSSSTGSGLRHFQMKQRRRRFDEQYQMAGDAVLIAPVSTQIPCQQGILQGILRFRGFLDSISYQETAGAQPIVRNSLR
jgi:hypothetical protein